ncbi:hypothetical protein A6763_05820 [Aeromonas caviae]|nr:hypothetical protein A6763_05820 [Aeromonas caviae]
MCAIGFISRVGGIDCTIKMFLSCKKCLEASLAGYIQRYQRQIIVCNVYTLSGKTLGHGIDIDICCNNLAPLGKNGWNQMRSQQATCTCDQKTLMF